MPSNSAGSTSFNVPIVDGGGGSGSLVINSSLVPNAPVSAGTVTLTAPSTYSGTTTVQGGILNQVGNNPIGLPAFV